MIIEEKLKDEQYKSNFKLIVRKKLSFRILKNIDPLYKERKYSRKGIDYLNGKR